MDSLAKLSDWLPELLLGIIAIMTVVRNRALHRRNDSLSDILTRVVQTSSDERLALTLKHAEEREKLRTECMLQLDSMQRTITDSFSRVLSQKLKGSPAPSRAGRGG